METNPYSDGVQAYKAGDPRSSNPHNFKGDRSSYYLWADGYDAAEFASLLRVYTPSGRSPFPALAA